MRKGIFTAALAAIAAVSMAWAAETLWLHRTDGISLGLNIENADSITVDASRSNIVVVGKDGSATAIPRAEVSRLTHGEAATAVEIVFNGTDATVMNPFAFEGVVVEKQGAAVSVSSTANVTVTYSLSGNATEGSLTINSDADVTVALNGVTLATANGAALTVNTTATTTLVLGEGTTTSLSETAAFAAIAGFDEKGCVEVGGSLTIAGSGALNVSASQSCGILAANSVTIAGGELNCTSDYGDALSAGGIVAMRGGRLVAQGGDVLGSSIKSGELFHIDGGTLVAIAGTVSEPAANSSNQNYVSCTIPALVANSTVGVFNAAGDEVLSFKAARDYSADSHLVISTPGLTPGASYEISCDGNLIASFQPQSGTPSATWTLGEIVDVESTTPEIDYGEVKIGDYYYSDGSWSDGGFEGFDRTGNGKVLWKSPKPAPTYVNPVTGASRKVIGIVYTTDPERMGEAEKAALKAKGVSKPHGMVMASQYILASWDNGQYDETEIGLGVVAGATPEDLYPTLNAMVSGYDVHQKMVANRYSGIAKGDYPVFNYLLSGAVDKYMGGPVKDAKTTGWYVPTPAQMFDIVRNFSGLDFTENPEWYYPVTTTRFNWQRDKYLSFFEKYPEDLIPLLNETLSGLKSNEKTDFPEAGDVNYMTCIFPQTSCFYCMPILNKYVSCEPLYKTNVQPVRFVLAF